MLHEILKLLVYKPLIYALAASPPSGDTPPPKSTLVLWQVPYIKRQPPIQVGDSVFCYQLVLQGIEEKTDLGSLYYSHSRVKVFPVKVTYNGTVFNFNQNPWRSESICYYKPGDHFKRFSVNWRELVCRKSVLLREELNPDEQLNHHILGLEYFCETSFLEEIIDDMNSIPDLKP